MSETISILERTDGLDAFAPRIVVVLPTFRRPDHLQRTLRSLAEQEGAEPFAVIVMENDADGRAGAAVAGAALRRGNLAGLVLVAHERGNCSAYNAGIETALETFPDLGFIAIIDDDELAAPDWLARLHETAVSTGADFVGGPQRPVFETEPPAKAMRHPVFAPSYAKTGRVPILYSSGNVLIKGRVLRAMPRPFLDPLFNFLGGGDSDFYARSREKGFTFAWCTEAVVFETVPARRTEFSWLNARSLRNGAISSIIERRRDGSLRGRARSLMKSAALLAAAPIRGLRLGLKARSAVVGLYPLQVAVGRFQGEIGIVNEQYRSPEQN